MELTDKKVLLGLSGGIAAYKGPELLRLFQKEGAQIRVMLTSGAQAFVSPLVLEALSKEKVLVQDDFLRPLGGLIPHTHWGAWAEAIVVAPASASFIAGLAQGDASSILAATIMASRAKVILCPAMNELMWSHPATQENIKRLRSFGYTILAPETGALACGDIGPGRLPSLRKIVEFTKRLLGPHDLKDHRVLVTAGPTREPIDRVRFISNRSSGRMGCALAQVAWWRGAEVYLIHGPLSVPPPVGPTCLPVETAQEMLEAVREYLSKVDIIIMAAAVADFVAAKPLDKKLKKRPHFCLELVQAPDILQQIKLWAKDQVVVGFAAEEGPQLISEAQRKLKEKGLDLIVANDISRSDIGFDAEENEVLIISRQGTTKSVPKGPKNKIAWAIWDEILQWQRDYVSK